MRLQALVLDAVTTAQPRYEPLLESLPSQYQAHAREVVDEFLNKDLRRGLRRCDLSTKTGKLSALRSLLSLAVEREGIVTITYRQDALGPERARQRVLRRAIVRIWDDEVYHEVYFRAVQTRVQRTRLDRMMGRTGGSAAATLADESAPRLRRLRAHIVMFGGRAMGKLGRETARGTGSPARYCAHNAALEITALLAYDVMAAVLNALPDFSEPLLMHPQRLASKVTQISGQELVHAQVFCDISRLLEGDADEEARSRLEQATRIVRSGAQWRHARGAAAAPPSERAVPKGGSLPSVLDAAIDVARLQSLERDLRASAAPSICVQSRVDVRQALSDHAWADVEAVATWIARWCATRSVKATIYVVDNRPGRLDARETLIMPTDTPGGQGMPLARVAQLTTHAVRPRSLTREGSIYSSDSDILHKVWWG